LPTSIARYVAEAVTDGASREIVHFDHGNLLVFAYPAESDGVRSWDLMVMNMTIAATEAVPEALVENVIWTLRPLEPNEILSGSARLVHREYLILDETSSWLFELQWTPGALEEMGVGVSSLGAWIGAALSAILALFTSRWVYRHHVYVELEAARNIMDQKELLLLALSHQLRTPLTAVIGFLGLVLDDRGDMGGSQQRELLDLAKHQAEDASDIVEDLMVAARMQDENLMLLPKPISVLPMVEAVFHANRGVDEALEVVPSKPEAFVFADALRIRQLIRNVFDEGRRAGARRWGVAATITGSAVDIVFLGDFKIVAKGRSPGLSLDQVATPGSRAAVRPHLTTATRLAEVMGGGITTLAVGGATAIHVLLPRPPVAGEELPEPLAAVGL
jgi:signal transduction histidine kinase